MDQQTPKYGIVLLAFAVACALTYWIRLKPVPAVIDVDLGGLPITLGDWHGEDAAVDEETRKGIGADELVSRIYSDGSLDDVALLVVYRKYGRRGFVHRPEMCFPAAGYEIIGKGHTKVPYGSRDVDAIRVVAQKEGDKVVILYWYVSGERTVADFARQQLLMALDRLSPHKYGWAFIRVTCPVLYSEEDAVERMRSFLNVTSGPLKQTLTHSQHSDAGSGD